MKKLIYLIIAIAVLGLIVSGCIPVVPPAPAEQSEPTSLTRQGSKTYYVRTDGDDTNDGLADDASRAWLTINRGTDPNLGSPLQSGDILKVADGTYTITSRIWVKIAGITITGNISSPGNVIVQYSPAANSLVFDMRANNVTIEGIKTISGKDGFFFDQGVTGCTISHCIIENTEQSGVYIYNGSGHTVEYTTIINPGQMGNLSYSNGIYTRAANTTIDHCIISSDKVKYMKWGVDIEAGATDVITGNTITGAWQAAIRVASGVKPVTITNNDIDDATEGYSVEGAISLDGHNDGSVILGNHIDNVVSSSAIVIWPAWNITISGNQIGVDDPSNDVRLEGIRIEGCGGSGANRVEVTGNIINNTGFAAILLNGDSSNTYIYNNIITNCNNYGLDSTGDWDYASIHVNEYSDNVIVDGNDISDGINGIQVWGDSCTVTNNEIYNMGVTYGNEKDVGSRTYKNSGILVGSNWGSGDIDPTGVIIENNNIHDNYWGLFYNLTNVIDATCNWWGDVSGPLDPLNADGLDQYNPYGLGDPVSEYVLYDPWIGREGMVTGGGWIMSPVGAYTPIPSLFGKATFGFVSTYKKGAAVPTGKTQFNFQVADLNFHSDSYDWMVIAGAKVMYKGTGTIKGAGNYGFMLFAIDEKLTSSTDVDKFRIKIWDKDDGDSLVYDNKNEENEDEDFTTEIGGGQIVIHKK